MGPKFRESGRPAYGKIVSQSTFTGDKIMIPAPGAGKEIVIMSISLNTSTCSFGTGSAGGSTFYYATAGSVSFPIGFGVGENKQVSTNAPTGRYIAINYYIHTL
jgi:hypothetical protein